MTPADWTEDARLEEIARGLDADTREAIARFRVMALESEDGAIALVTKGGGADAAIALLDPARAFLDAALLGSKSDRLLRERREAVELLRDCALALESAAALATRADMKQSIAPSYHEDAARVRAFLSSIAEKTE